jgi:hypothetical protein
MRRRRRRRRSLMFQKAAASLGRAMLGDHTSPHRLYHLRYTADRSGVSPAAADRIATAIQPIEAQYSPAASDRQAS